MIIYEPDTRTKIIIKHDAGYREECKIRDSMVELADQDMQLIDILDAAISTDTQLERLQDRYYHADTLLDNIKAHLDKLPRKPLKEDLVNFVKDLQSEIENSYHEF